MVLRSTSSGTRARIASGLLQSLAGLRTERIRAGQPVAIAEQGHESVRLVVGARVRSGLRHASYSDGRAEGGLIRADEGRLRSRLRRRLFAGLLSDHVFGVPVRPVRIMLADALFVLAVSDRRASERGRELG